MSNERKFLSVGRETDRCAEDYDECFISFLMPSGSVRRIYLEERDLLRVVVQSAQLLEHLERERREKGKP